MNLKKYVMDPTKTPTDMWRKIGSRPGPPTSPTPGHRSLSSPLISLIWLDCIAAHKPVFQG